MRWPVCFVVAAVTSMAQAIAADEPQPAARPLNARLRVTIVLGAGERSSGRTMATYSLVVANDMRPTSFVIGAAGAPEKSDSSVASSRDTGARIKCGAKTAGAGGFALDLDLEISGPRRGGPSVPGSVQTVSITTTAILHDGERSQLASGTDPLSGEATWVDVSLEVLKSGVHPVS